MRRYVCALLVPAAVALIQGRPADAQQPDEAAALAALRQLDVTDLDGKRWTHATLRGRVVLIDFWATWCAPCLADIPKLQALRARYAREDFEILGISLDATSRRSLQAFLNRHRMDWPQIHQRLGYGSDVARLFRIEQLPVTVLLDRDGSVDAVHVRGDALAARVHALVTSSTPPEPVR